jgi:MFS family permease
MRSVLADITPLRRYRNFRRLWFGLAVSGIGTQLTVVAVAYQAYTMTNSTAVVGLISVVCLLPTLVGSLGGGSVADSMDRRRLLILTQVLLALSSAGLAVNAMLPHPELWVLFVASATTAAFQGIDWPTRLSVLPMIVPAEDLPNAYALQSVVNNVAVVAGPALAGLIIAAFGLGSVYLIDVVSFGATFTAAILLPPLRPAGGTSPSVRSVVDGLKYLTSQKLLAATFLLDLNAMVFGMPKAVFPALGTELFHGGAATVGLLYAAPGAGSLLASLLSGWVGDIRSQGRALVVCMLIWGGAIALFGVIPVLWIGLILLAIAGGSDIIGGVFRVAILQKSTPQHMQGRLGGVFYAAAVSGNRLGDGESGLAAAIGGPQFAVWSGGLACIVGTVVLAWRIPALRHKERGGAPAPKSVVVAESEL